MAGPTLLRHDGGLAGPPHTPERTTWIASKNRAAVSWSAKGSSTSMASRAYLLRFVVLHHSKHRFSVARNQNIPRPINTMANDASRHWDLNHTYLFLNSQCRKRRSRIEPENKFSKLPSLAAFSLCLVHTKIGRPGSKFAALCTLNPSIFVYLLDQDILVHPPSIPQFLSTYLTKILKHTLDPSILVHLLDHNILAHAQSLIFCIQQSESSNESPLPNCILIVIQPLICCQDKLQP